MYLSPVKKYKTPATFDELFADDPFGLLDNVGEKRVRMSASEKVMAIFEEVADFIKENDKMPDPQSDDFDEVILFEKYSALVKEFPEGEAYCRSLIEGTDEDQDDIQVTLLSENTDNMQSLDKDPLDEQIESMQQKSYQSFEDVFDDDPLGLLANVGDKPIEKETWRSTQNIKDSKDTSARQAICKDFYKYQRYFDEINSSLESGHLKAIPIIGDSASINFGDIFIIDGIVSIIADVYADTDRQSSDKSKRQYRVRQILSTGKESQPWSTTIKASFYKTQSIAMRVVYADATGYTFLSTMRDELEKASEGSQNSIMSGYIYILQSKSKNKELVEFTANSSLIKIGFCTTSVKQRIANAKNEPTYLCAPVEIIKTFKCYNFDPRNLEDVLHTILRSHRLNIELTDKDGKKYKPKEWFTVSAQTACDIVDHIFAEDIADYYVDNVQGLLKRKIPSGGKKG